MRSEWKDLELKLTLSSTDWPSFSSSDSELDVICKLSRFYGSDPSIVLAGGGNTSCKMGDRLYVKASGTSLASITPDGFVEMDREKLDDLANSTFDEEPEVRESQFKAAISAARCKPELGQRPSVEVLLHHLLPHTYVVHSHATIANALTCHADGPQLAKEIFGDRVLWLPYVDPGFTLAQGLKKALHERTSQIGDESAAAILMANHGLIVCGDQPDGIRNATDNLLERIAARLGYDWTKDSFGDVKMLPNSMAEVRRLGPALRGLLANGSGAPLRTVTFEDNDVARAIVGTAPGKAAACAGPMTPDQIVYCGSYPMWFELQENEDDQQLVSRLGDAIRMHTDQTRFAPKIVLVAGVGLFASGENYREATTARDVYLDAAKVMAGATRLGGISYLTDGQRRFIEDWEVESYRRGVAAASAKSAGRLTNRIVVVTGAAQGFGLEIARGLADEGASTVLGDVNESGVAAAADELCDRHGSGAALGLAMNVTDSASIEQAVDEVVRTYGGFDVFISNAGVLRAESVKTQPETDFDFVTSVNYKGYYLCVQSAAPILAIQHAANSAYMGDIIQINSKSGLAGSKKNFAYAGSKFGGIGLTQSFALELIEDGIKVNSVCPGNFLDGPLWSDPDKGLFVQYLHANKVPGARTIADVKRAYEAKVPMGRGCTTADVLKAILYLIEQRYETGQALPVTGGQEMLR